MQTHSEESVLCQTDKVGPDSTLPSIESASSQGSGERIFGFGIPRLSKTHVLQETPSVRRTLDVCWCQRNVHLASSKHSPVRTHIEPPTVSRRVTRFASIPAAAKSKLGLWLDNHSYESQIAPVDIVPCSSRGRTGDAMMRVLKGSLFRLSLVS